MGTPNLWFLQKYETCDFCTYSIPDKLKRGGKDLYSNVFIEGSRLADIATGVSSVKFNCVLLERQPARNNNALWDWHSTMGCVMVLGQDQFKYQKSVKRNRHCNYLVNQKRKSDGDLCICLWSPWLIYPQNVYTVAFVYLLSLLHDRCSGTILIHLRL